MTQANYQLRPATEADYEYCYRLTKQNMQTLFTRHWGDWVPSSFRKDFCAEETTLIQINQQNVGYFSLKETEETLYISNIQLEPAVQRQGLGSAILTDILQANLSKQIQLTTFTDNPAMRLYERLSFEVTERDGETVHMTKAAGK